METEKLTRDLTEKDRLDVTLTKKDKVLYRFALNYRAYINENWKEIYRVDNYHKFLHEQKFWRSPETIPIQDKKDWPLRMTIKHYIEKICLNFPKYRRYYEKALRKRKINPK
ncbi:hypothetical protein GOV03_03470 [Candidatus Woesearchaeota archaeon]|nr:hypothetical protein [Candidatus Woesearchaeota archaeon]